MNKLMNNCIQNSACHIVLGNSSRLVHCSQWTGANRWASQEYRDLFSLSLGFNQQSCLITWWCSVNVSLKTKQSKTKLFTSLSKLSSWISQKCLIFFIRINFKEYFTPFNIYSIYPNLDFAYSKNLTYTFLLYGF